MVVERVNARCYRNFLSFASVLTVVMTVNHHQAAEPRRDKMKKIEDRRIEWQVGDRMRATCNKIKRNKDMVFLVVMHTYQQRAH